MEQTETWQKIEKRPGLCVVRACVCVPERETGGGKRRNAYNLAYFFYSFFFLCMCVLQRNTSLSFFREEERGKTKEGIPVSPLAVCSLRARRKRQSEWN